MSGDSGNISSAEKSADDAKRVRRVPWLEMAARIVLLVLTVAYVAGYLAWGIGTRVAGMTMLSPDPTRLVTLGGLSLLVAGAFALAAYIGVQFMEDSRAKNRRVPWILGALVAGVLGMVFMVAVLVLLTSSLIIIPEDVTIVVLGMVGLLLPASTVIWVAYLLRDEPEQESSDQVSPMTPNQKIAAAAAMVLTLVAAGVVTGVAVVPVAPASYGGLSPQIALVELQPNDSAILSGLETSSGSTVVGDRVLVPVWVLATHESAMVVRHACQDVHEAAAYSIPHDSVHAIQWLTEPSRQERCT